MVDKIWYNMEELIGGSEERVLIETYWNVKRGVVLDSDCCTICINRNILECKGIQAEDNVGFVAVLIETYWNVKLLYRGGIRL